MVFLILLFLAAFYFLAQTAFSLYYFSKSPQLVRTSYSRKTVLGDETKTSVFKLFLDGDSVGAGVGASSFGKSVAGRIGLELSKRNLVEFENNSVSGKKMADLIFSKTPETKQDLIVLIISSNDLFRFTDLKKFKSSTSNVMQKYQPLAKKIIVVGPGRVFDSRAIPFFMRWIYKSRAKDYASIIKEEVSKFDNTTHINPLLTQVDLSKYGQTLASDNFHPNDNGHLFWFDLIKEKL